MNLVWNVYRYNINSREIIVYNIFDHWGFRKEILDFYKNTPIITKESLEKKLKSSMMYYFWSRCEWEIILSEWPPAPPERKTEIKIDVFDQVQLNWDVFVNYIYTHLSEMDFDEEG